MPVEPGFITGPVEDDRLSIVQVLHRLAGGRGEDGAAGDVKIGVLRPESGKRKKGACAGK